MSEWLKQNATYNKIILSLFIGLLSFFALQIYNKVDALPDKFVGITGYLNDQLQLKAQYATDQRRVEVAISEIQKDVKEILKALK